MDWDDMLLAPHYRDGAPHAVDALLVTRGGDEKTLRVIDKTSGIEVTLGGELGVPTVKPAVAVRQAALVDQSIARVDLVDGQITVNEVRWRIRQTAPKGSTQGESKGEIYLLLERETQPE